MKLIIGCSLAVFVSQTGAFYTNPWGAPANADNSQASFTNNYGQQPAVGNSWSRSGSYGSFPSSYSSSQIGWGKNSVHTLTFAHQIDHFPPTYP